MPQLTLIGHRYLGPGNPLDNGEPTNTADAIARQHDHEYHHAVDKQDIFESDRKAIAAFADDFARNKSIGGLIGAAGLSIKHGVEKLTDTVLYPRTFPGKYGTAKTRLVFETWLHC